jgi:hypothetical protein
VDDIMRIPLFGLLGRDRRNSRRSSRSSATRGAARRRTLSYESLEKRELLAVTTLSNMSVSENTGEKPQSKVWEHAGQWWSVMPKSDGTWVWRLDGTTWTPTLRLTTDDSFHADVKAHGNVTHALLFDDGDTQLASIQYVAATNNYQMWSLRPQLVNIALPSSAETATIDIDSLGRMWLCYDVSSTVEVRYSDGNYSAWSAPITVATGISSDDIAVITAMPNNQIGVLWSNQSADRFGFRVHVDGASPSTWLAPEVPALQSAANNMADDHLNVAVASNGTIYAAVKTSFDSSSRPEIALLVRRPNGVWDASLYQVDTLGTRPIVVLNEAAGRIIVAYTTSDSGGNIVYKESSMDVINFGSSRQTLISGSLNNVTSTKQNFTNSAVFLASGGSSARGVVFSFNSIIVNQAPVVDAGPNRTVAYGDAAALDGSVSDDGQPTPATLSTAWSRSSGPGTVTFGNAGAVDTTAQFSEAGTYVLRLTASDGQRTTFDEMTVTVQPPTTPIPNPDDTNPGGGGTTDPPPVSSDPVEIAFQNGLFPSVSYAGTRDTHLSSGSATTNFGNSTTLLVDGSPDLSALIKWDVSAIPADSIVVSAAIELTVSNSSKHTYELYTLNRAWDELSATWQRYATNQNWSTAGANSTADRGSDVLGTLASTRTGLYRIALNDAGVAAVQAWINDATDNYGVIIQDYAVSDGADIRSSEYATASQRPKLIINYQPASTASTSLAVATSEGDLEPLPPTNLPPTVNAGADLSLTLGSLANLRGAVSDDGLPADGLLTAVWSRISGPGSVAFSNAGALDSTAQFGAAGTYVLRLTVSDGELSAFDELTVNVVEPVTEPVETTTTTTTTSTTSLVGKKLSKGGK